MRLKNNCFFLVNDSKCDLADFVKYAKLVPQTNLRVLNDVHV